MFSIKMFQDATLKLTMWYLLIIMLISLLFSSLVYQYAFNDIRMRLEQFGQGIPTVTIIDPTFNIRELRSTQVSAASQHIMFNLILMNVIIFICGGIASFLLARKTLKPIKESHQAQSRFVSDASHEFRTPLAVMKAELEVALRAKNITNKEMRQLLASNLEEVDKLSKLSSTLLSLSRMDYASLVHEPIVLNDVIKSSLKSYTKLSNRIKFSSKSRRLIVDAHQPSLEELLSILLDNALKYSPPRSTVDVSLKKHGGKAMFQVTNLGKGIDPDDLPHIFDRFYQADNARSHSQETSFGLGLSLAKKIVELHGGELTASSAPGEKTTFSVCLPIVEKSRKISSFLRKSSAD